MRAAGVIAALGLLIARRQAAAGALLLIAVTTATATLALAFDLGTPTASAWTQVYARTKGSDVLAVAGSSAAVDRVLRSPQVTRALGPEPLITSDARVGGRPLQVSFVGRASMSSAVDQPAVVAGSARLSGATVILERTFAETLGSRVGDRVRVGSRELTVGGIAETASQPPFPRYGPGLAWVSIPTARSLEGPGATVRFEGEASLRGPEAAFARAEAAPGLAVFTAAALRTYATADDHTIHIVLLTATLLLALLASGAAAILLLTRMTARLQQVAILKAIGLSPGQVTALGAAGQSVVALLASGAGLVIGHFLAGVVGRQAHPGIPAPAPGVASPVEVAAIIAVALAIVEIPEAVLAWRLARRPVAAMLKPPAPRHRRHRRPAAVRLPLPFPVSFGILCTGRRPGRQLLAAGSLALSAAIVTSSVSMDTTFAAQEASAAHQAAASPDEVLVALANQAFDSRIQSVVYLFVVIFALVGLVNAFAVAANAARLGARDHAVMRAVGLAPRQVAISHLAGQAPATLLAAAAGVPLGLLLFRAVYMATNTGPHPVVDPAAVWLAAVAALTVLACAALAAIPAYWLASQTVSRELTVE